MTRAAHAPEAGLQGWAVGQEAGARYDPGFDCLEDAVVSRLVCPEVIANRPAVAAFRNWLLEESLRP